jgi:hypothetical protein
MYRNPPYNPDAKTFYYPIEAALRWCKLLAFEDEILLAKLDSPWSCRQAFPQWPCLGANIEKILDAIQSGELPFGCLGLTVQPETPVETRCLTIRHTDLKAWMAHYYPDQKPTFLFDAVERTTHQAISFESFQVLQADREALENKVAEHQQSYRLLLAQNAELEQAKGLLMAQISNQPAEASDRSETTHLNIIGSLLHLLLSNSPSGKPYSSFRNQTSIISSIVAHHRGRLGITERTLERKFAAARRSLNRN